VRRRAFALASPLLLGSGCTFVFGLSDLTTGGGDAGSDGVAPDVAPDVAEGAGSSSGSSSGSGSSGGSGASDGAVDGSASTVGFVQFTQCIAGFCAASPIFHFTAAFFDSPRSPSGCTVTTSGTCSAFSCPADAGGGGAVSAGTIHISGGNLGAGQSVTPGADGTYAFTANAAEYSAGQTLAVSASGAVAPAFGPQSISAPSLIDLVAPAADDGGTYTIATSSDLTVAWTGGQSGDLVLVEAADPTWLNYFSCSWDASAGQGTIPRTVLSVLAGRSGDIVWLQESVTAFQAGSYSIAAATGMYGAAAASFQ
jgi:hypothetical protein